MQFHQKILIILLLISLGICSSNSYKIVGANLCPDGYYKVIGSERLAGSHSLSKINYCYQEKLGCLKYNTLNHSCEQCMFPNVFDLSGNGSDNYCSLKTGYYHAIGITILWVLAIYFVMYNFTNLGNIKNRKFYLNKKDTEDCEEEPLNCSIICPVANPNANENLSFQRKNSKFSDLKFQNLNTESILNSLGNSNSDSNMLGPKEDKTSHRTFVSVDNRYIWNSGKNDHIGICFRSLNNIQDNRPDSLRII